MDARPARRQHAATWAAVVALWPLTAALTTILLYPAIGVRPAESDWWGLFVLSTAINLVNPLSGGVALVVIYQIAKRMPARPKGGVRLN